MGYVALPEYRPGGQIDFGPVNQAFTAISQQNNIDAQMKMRQQGFDADQKQREFENSRATKQDASQQVQMFGKQATAVDQMDGPQRAAAWNSILAKHGTNGLTPEELDPVTGPKLMAAQAGQWVDPLDRQEKVLGLEKTRAEIKSLNSKDAFTSMLDGLLNKPDNTAAPGMSQGGAPQVQPQSYGGAPINPVLQQASMSGAAQPGPTVQAAQGLRPGVQLTADNGTDPTAPEDGGPSPTAPGAVYAMPGNEPVQTPFGTMSRDKARKIGAAAAIAGKGDLSKIMIDAATGGGGHLSKSGATINDKDELGATGQMAALEAVKQSFDPKYLNIPNRAGMWGKSLQDKFGTLSPTDQKSLGDYTTWRAQTWGNLNRVLKDLSGTAVTENEMQRQLLQQPNPGQGIADGDSPTEFAAKLKNQLAFATSAIARARYLRSQGFVGKPWEANLAVEDMPRIINQRGQQLEQQLKQQNPQADPMQLQQAVTKQIKQEFGI